MDLSDGSALLAALRENDKIRVLPDDQLEFKVRGPARWRCAYRLCPHYAAGCDGPLSR